VVRVLRSDWLTQGPDIEEFERAVARYCGVRHAVAVSSGTAALHIACLALGLGPGKALWTSPNSFVASANCARYCGASVDFVDIDPRTLNMSVTALRDKLASAESKGCLPAALVPVHFGGQPCEMAEIRSLCARYGVSVIEDASHALGAEYRGVRTGNCAYADATVLSFHPVKIITSGEGGMVLTDRDDLHRALMRLRTHGITRDADQMTRPVDGPWYYEQTDLGYNYRMTDIHAVLGLSQFGRLEEFLARRRELASRYRALLQGLPLKPQWQHPDCFSAWHLYAVRLDSTGSRMAHREAFAALRQRGILVNLHYIPVHLQPYYRALGFAEGDFPEAERYYREAISLPMFYGLTDTDQERVATTLREVLA
jgi:UDP-4-amino-4,6-dideoxy-N-acetyl-beta-L-altrosamine transaminase